MEIMADDNKKNDPYVDYKKDQDRNKREQEKKQGNAMNPDRDEDEVI